jgi:hypothetical protein
MTSQHHQGLKLIRIASFFLLLSLLTVLWVPPSSALASQTKIRTHSSPRPRRTGCQTENADVPVIDQWQQTSPKFVTPGCNHTIAVGFAPIAGEIDVAACDTNANNCQFFLITSEHYYAYFVNVPSTFVYRWKLHDPSGSAYGTLMTMYF